MALNLGGLTNNVKKQLEDAERGISREVGSLQTHVGVAVRPIGFGNTDQIFDHFDMIVSLREKTINDQLRQLADQGHLENELTFIQELDGNDYVYKRLGPSDPIPADTPYIRGKFTPQIAIKKSGQEVNFVLEFTSGDAATYPGGGRLAKLVKSDVAGWKYGVSIDLALHRIQNRAQLNGMNVPQNVQQQLTHFVDNMFSVNYLLLDFQSSDLKTNDPAITSVPDDFVSFFTFYFENLAKNNPYVLGYSIDSTPQSRVDTNAKVPAQLDPVGTTFSVTADGDRSSLNFVLVTQGGHGRITGSPTSVTRNTYLDSSAGAIMGISHSCLLEDLILRPIFEQVRSSAYAGISRHISVSAGNSYEQARSQTANGYSFDIAHDTSGDDQYTNAFQATIENSGGRVTCNLSGRVWGKKSVSKGRLFCTAHASAQGSVSWAGSVEISVANSSLSISHNFRITGHDSDSDKNDCAKAFSWVGKILGGIVDVFSGFADGGYFSNLLSNALSVNIPGVGGLNVGISNFGNSIGSVVVLPTGATFHPQSVAADRQGNIYVNLKLQS